MLFARSCRGVMGGGNGFGAVRTSGGLHLSEKTIIKSAYADTLPVILSNAAGSTSNFLLKFKV